MAADQPAVDTSKSSHYMGWHGNAPAGVHGADMIGAGKFAFSYAPMFMLMTDNYINSMSVSTQTIIGSTMYRVVPTAMDAQSHMLNFMYGVTDNLNIMVMASYLKKSMDMTTYSNQMSPLLLGTSTASTSGVGDTVVSSLWRISGGYNDAVNLTLGLSLPTGSETQSITMLSPAGTIMMPMTMTMRASYGMQLGTDTYVFCLD